MWETSPLLFTAFVGYTYLSYSGKACVLSVRFSAPRFQKWQTKDWRRVI